MGGPSTPAIGFAIGVERLALITPIDALSGKPAYFFAYVGEEAKHYLVPILRSFISEGLSFNYAYEGKSLKSQMRFADSLNADYVLILGDDEIAKGIIVMRDMRNKSQYELPLDPHGLAKAVLKLTPDFPLE